MVRIRSVMQRLGATSISRAVVRTVGNQSGGNRRLKSSRRRVQRRITSVEVMVDLDEEARRRGLTRRAGE